jgi:hypothetical protein
MTLGSLRIMGSALTGRIVVKKILFSSAALALALAFSGTAFADKASAPGQNKTCLITFGTNAEATAGADATILATKYLPAKAAGVQETYTGGGAVRIFDYSGVVANNAEERALCKSLAPN